MIFANRAWYVVQTQPHCENKAVVHLARQGFGTYLPRYLKRRRHARRIEIVPAPLFPRYLFIEIDMRAQRWRSIYSTVGVSRLICAGETPLPVNQQILTTLREREDDAGFVRLESGPRFRIGEKVQILHGVFADCLGLYEGISDCDRVSVLLDLLGRKVRVVMDADAIAAA